MSMQRLDIRLHDIPPPGAEPSWLPEAYRWALARLIEAGDAELAASTWRARTLVAREVAAAYFGQLVSEARMTATGRVVGAPQGGGTDGCLLLAWFDADSDVRAIELADISQATPWILSPDGRHVAVVDRQARLVEAHLESSTSEVVWTPHAGMRSYSYDYTDPDHILIVADFHGGAPAQAHLLRRTEDDGFARVAQMGEVDCDDVTWAAPFAFLSTRESNKRTVLGVRGDRLVHLGICAFPSPPWDLAELDGAIVYTTKGVVHRVDGLFEALDAALARPAAAPGAPAASAALSGIDRVLALSEALHLSPLNPALDQPHVAFRRAILGGLRVGEGGFSFFLDEVPARSEAELRDLPAHSLVVWMTHADGIVELYAVPDAGLTAEQHAALELPGATFAGPEDLEDRPRDWAHCVRLMAALGSSGTVDEEFYEMYVDNASWGDVPAPAREEIDGTWASWRRHAVRSAAGLDRRFTRLCVLTLAM